MNSYTGIVESGTKRAAPLGYPTVNIPLPDAEASGIYAARVHLEDGSSYVAAVYADQTRKVLEAHLLDFSDELYGQEILVELHKKIRDDKKFDDDTTLREAIAHDVEAVREYFDL